MSQSALSFAQPLWIAAGVVLAGLGLAGFLRSDRHRRLDLQKLAHPRFHPRLMDRWSPGLRWTRRAMWLLAIFSVCVAAARPRYGEEWREVKRRGIDILFAVDTSRSMLAEDLPPNRLERARLGILDFVNQLQGDRVGLVPFAGTAFALCPLTLDYQAFRDSLDALGPDLIPRPGTDLASAIHEAERLFEAEGNNHRLLVLITDGEDLEGEALDAAKAAAKKGMTIYTVGVGGAEGQTIPMRDRYGRVSNLRDEKGEIVTTRLDENTLKQIADATRGLYVPLGRGAEGLETIYQKRLSLVPKSELAQSMEKIPLERFQWPLGLAIGLMLMQSLLGERKMDRRKTTLLTSAARRVRPVAMVLLAALLTLHAGATISVEHYNSGTRAYSKGNYESAAEQLKASLESSDLSLQAKSYYNLGNAHYRLGEKEQDPKQKAAKWELALKAYNDALALDPEDRDAEYNRDFVKKKLDELKKQEEQQQKQQKQQDQQDQKQDQQQKQQNQQDQKGQQQEQSQQGEKKEEQAKSADQKNDQANKAAEEKNDNGKSKGMEDQRNEGRKPDTPAEEAGRAKEQKADGQDAQTAAQAGRNPGEMSKDEAIRLLKSLSDDERVVVPVPLSERNLERQRSSNSNSKTW